MNAMEAAGSDAERNAAGEKTGTEKLRSGDHAVLAGGYASDQLIAARYVAFRRHT
jgi:hypothetical protein